MTRRSYRVPVGVAWSPRGAHPRPAALLVATAKLAGVDQVEEPLFGGNAAAGVVRVGGTARRPAGPHTPAVHALLSHLHAAGFGGAPRPLGIDERGREVLSFIPGTVPWPDH